MTDERQALIAARDALHRLCLERGSTDGYVETFEKINAALSRVAPSPERDTERLRGSIELLRHDVADRPYAESVDRLSLLARLDAMLTYGDTNEEA